MGGEDSLRGCATFLCFLGNSALVCTNRRFNYSRAPDLFSGSIFPHGANVSLDGLFTGLSAVGGAILSSSSCFGTSTSSRGSVTVLRHSGGGDGGINVFDLGSGSTSMGISLPSNSCGGRVDNRAIAISGRGVRYGNGTVVVHGWGGVLCGGGGASLRNGIHYERIII